MNVGPRRVLNLMNHVLSTHLFVNHRLTVAGLEKIHHAGIPAVEFFCARMHLDWHDHAQIVELGHFFRDSDLKLFSMHAPMHSDDCWGRSGPQATITITELVKARRIQMVDEIKRALEIAEYIPFRYLNQHLGCKDEEWEERKVDAAFNSLDELSNFARQRGVEILLENTPNGFSSAQRLVSFLEMTHLNLGFCFDTGHANLGEGVPAAFETMKPRIRSTHIHDNDGKTDQHLFPMHSSGGTIDWKNTMELLRSGADQFPLVLELYEVAEMPNPLEVVNKVFDSLESA
jgi:sugar phosphate isomerase/epimerase